jgi:hypothetical protein
MKDGFALRRRLIGALQCVPASAFLSVSGSRSDLEMRSASILLLPSCVLPHPRPLPRRTFLCPPRHRMQALLSSNFDASQRAFSHQDNLEQYTLVYRMCTQRAPAKWDDQLYKRHGTVRTILQLLWVITVCFSFLGGSALPHVCWQRSAWACAVLLQHRTRLKVLWSFGSGAGIVMPDRGGMGGACSSCGVALGISP